MIEEALLFCFTLNIAILSVRNAALSLHLLVAPALGCVRSLSCWLLASTLARLDGLERPHFVSFRACSGHFVAEPDLFARAARPPL